MAPRSTGNLWSVLTQLQVRGFRFILAAVTRFQEDLVSLRAMSLTYATLLSLVPFLAVTFSVLKGFGIQNQVEPLLARALEPLGSQGSEITARLIDFVNNLRVGVLGAVGVAGLFYTTVSLLGQIEDSLNHIWRVRRPRTWAQRFRDYLSVVLVGPVLVFTALALTASAQSYWVVQRLFEMKALGVVFVAATRILPFIFLCSAFTFLYKFMPQTHVRLSSALLGGASAGILWQLAGAGFAAFVAGSTRYAAIYSSFAVLILFLIWLYVGWLIILLGGEIAYLHQYPHVSRLFRVGSRPPFRERPALLALVEIARRHLSGKPPRGVAQLASDLGVPVSSVEDVIDEFVRRGIVVRTVEPEAITLARAPELITAPEILEILRGPESNAAQDDAADPVANVLHRRDRAIRDSLDGITLRSLASETSASGADRPASPAGRPPQPPTAQSSE